MTNLVNINAADLVGVEPTLIEPIMALVGALNMGATPRVFARYRKVTDAAPRIAGEHYLDNGDPHAHYGQAVKVSRSKAGNITILVRSDARSDGAEPGWTAMRLTGFYNTVTPTGKVLPGLRLLNEVTAR